MFVEQEPTCYHRIACRMAEYRGWIKDTFQATVGQLIHLRITRDEVVHGFAIGKSDQPSLEILPGEFVYTTLTFDQPGKYILNFMLPTARPTTAKRARGME